MTKKISGEYFKENRDFVPQGERIKELLEGKIEKARRDIAQEFMELQESQRKSREQTFKAYGMDMPLPPISKKEYLERHIPMDAWLYSQYGAILYPQEDGSVKISSDGSNIIIDRELRGKSMAEINGVPQKKEEKAAESQEEKASPEEAPLAPPAPELEREEGEPLTDILAPNRKRRELELRRRRREKTIIWTVTGGVLVLGVLVLALAVYKLS